MISPTAISERIPEARPEVSPHFIKELPVLVLFPHNRCNCRCIMCDIWKIRQAREIRAQDLAPHLESLRSLKVRWIVFSGGEPLLHTDLPSLSELLRKEGIRLTLLTAGLLLERHARMAAACFDDLMVSLDGPPEIHDFIRNVPGAYERLAKGVAAVRRIAPDRAIHGRATVQKFNRQHLRQTVRAAHEIKLNSISFLAADVVSDAFNRPGGWDRDRQGVVLLDNEETQDLCLEMEALISECREELESGFILESAAKLRRIVHHFESHCGAREPVAPRCNAPWVSAVIETDGSVRPCFFHPPMGNIHSSPLTKIMNSERAMDFRQNLDVSSNPTCQRCVCSLYLPT